MKRGIASVGNFEDNAILILLSSLWIEGYAVV